MLSFRWLARDRSARWCRVPVIAAARSPAAWSPPWVVLPGPPGPGGNDHGGFRSQFGQQVFEKLVGTAGFEPATP